MELIIYYCFVLASLLLLDMTQSTACPPQSNSPTILSSNSDYSFVNCILPVNASGVELSNVLIAFVNSPPGRIVLTGSRLFNVTIIVRQSDLTSFNLLANLWIEIVNISVMLSGVTVMAPLSRYSASDFTMLQLVVGSGLSPGDLDMSNITVHVEDSSFQRPLLVLALQAERSFTVSQIRVNIVRSMFSALNGSHVIRTASLVPSGSTVTADDFLVHLINSTILDARDVVGFSMEQSVGTLSRVSLVVAGGYFAIRGYQFAVVCVSPLNSGMTITHLAVNMSQVHCEGRVFYVNSISVMDGIQLNILSSNVTDVGSESNLTALVSMNYVDTIAGRGFIVLLENSTAMIEYAVFLMWFVNIVLGPVTFNTTQGTRVSCIAGPMSFTTAFVALTNLTSVRNSILIDVLQSTVNLSVSAGLAVYTLAFVQVSGVIVESENGGAVVVIARQSVIELSQIQTFVFDICAFFALVGVVTDTSRGLSLRVDNHSSVLVSCAGTACVLCALQSPSLSLSLAAADATITVKTITSSQKNWISEMVTGSFVVLLLNSTVVDSFMSVQRCSIACGVVCEVKGTHWNNGKVYDAILTSALLYTPPDCPTLDRANWFVLEESSVRRLPTTTLFVQSRALFSFDDSVNTTVVVKGPINIFEEGFAGLTSVASALVSGGIPSVDNRLLFWSCERVHVFDWLGKAIPLAVAMSSAAASSPANGGTSIINVSSRRASGRGACPSSLSMTFPRSSSKSSSKSLRATRSRTAYLPAAIERPKLSVTHKVLAACVGLAVLVSGPAAATSVQRLHAQMLVSGCPDGLDGAPPDIASSPTQMAVGPFDGNEFDRGAVVGNAVIMTSIGILALVLLSFAAPRQSNSIFALPGSWYIVYFMLLVPTVTSSTTLMIESSLTGDALISGVVGYVLFTLIPLGVLGIHATKKFGAVAVKVSNAGRSRRRGRSVIRLLRQWFASAYEFHSLRNSPGFAERWEYAGLTAYVPHRQWFILVEQVFAVAGGLTAGLTALGSSWCRALNILQTVQAVAFLALVLTLRPYGAQADRWNATFNAVLQTVTAMLGLFGTDASFIFSVIQIFVSSAYVAGGLYFLELAKFKHCLFPWMRRRKYKTKGTSLTSGTDASGMLQGAGGGSAPVLLSDDDLRQLMLISSSRADGEKQEDADGLCFRDRSAALAFLVESICRAAVEL